MGKKVFLITIDTEADNQWDNTKECSTENVRYLPKFQELSEKYGYKPTWLITYEIAENDDFVKYFKKKQKENFCEIGMHLHAWSTPPYYKLEGINNERPYLVEYPNKIMEEKIKQLDKLITKKFGVKPISHRAGRWTTNNDYFALLDKYGYKIDCSVTPHINWEKCLGMTGLPGSNYQKESEKYYYVYNNILEIPVTIRKIYDFQLKRIINVKKFVREIQYAIIGKNQWIRPDETLLKDGMIKVIDKCSNNSDYIMFMIHSSELMPGGSPNFKNNDSIEKLYELIDYIFKYAQSKGYVGMTLKEYYEYLKDKGKYDDGKEKN